MSSFRRARPSCARRVSAPTTWAAQRLPASQRRRYSGQEGRRTGEESWQQGILYQHLTLFNSQYQSLMIAAKNGVILHTISPTFRRLVPAFLSINDHLYCSV